VARSRFNDPIEPMTLGDTRANGARSLAVSPDRPFVGKRSLAGFGDRHPDNGNPPSAGAHRSRLDRGQPIAREPVQQRIREAMGQHVRHRAAMLRVGE
jgi:hypothetical protein